MPGHTTRLTVHGTELNESLRVATSPKDVAIRVESVSATQAIVEVTLPTDAPLGPFGLWMANATGPLKQQVLVADDLPPVADNGVNHSIETAQPISNLCAVEGVCDASKSDFYRLTVAEGQRVAVEVHAQMLRSAFDPVVRLLDADGKTLVLADDNDAI